MKESASVEKKLAPVLLALALTLGAAMRLFPILRADFPLADGGMFYAMVGDLRAADFALPEFTSYNRADIPFAYPPLGFYLAGLLNALSGAPVLEILRWLPFAASLLALPLHYFFAKQAADSEAKAALATFIFALTPGSYWWNIVGGGLTRSLGVLFFTASALSMLQMYRRRSRGWLAAAMVSAAAVVLSHPAWALETVLAALVLWFFFGRDKRGFLDSLLLAAGVLLLTAPWWGLVVQRHGWEVFLNATRNAYSLLQALAILVMHAFSSETVPVSAFFGMCGLFIHLARKKYVLPAWVALCFLVEPRSGAGASLLPFSLLAADALAEGVLSRLTASVPPLTEWSEALWRGRGRLFFGFFAFMLLFNSYQASEMISRRVLSAEERAAIDWVRSQTDPSSRFLILDETDNPVYSPLTEWFPALSGRRSVATIQGAEWLPGDRNFARIFPAVTGAHECFFRDAECLRRIRPRLPDGYDYVMLSAPGGSAPLLESLRADDGFALLYSSKTVFIFRAEPFP